MTLLHEVVERELPIARIEPVIGHDRFDRLVTTAARLRARLGGRTIWNISSVAIGGGVAEMLQVIVGYVAGFDISIRWTVIGGDPLFFAITKRLHNQLHGAGDGAEPFSSAEIECYERVQAANAAELLTQIRPGDVALLHDPQTAGLAGPLARAGVKVVWRCHIGVDRQNEVARAAWDFLRPYLAPVQGYVFTRRQYAPPWVPRARTWVIPPSIDPLSAKNVPLEPAAIDAILATMGVYDGAGPRAPGRFMRNDGTIDEVRRQALVTGDGRPGPGDQLVVQISRWDRLKDMAGVMRGFAENLPPGGNSYLLLAGPAAGGVADDPESAIVFAECVALWHELPAAARERMLLVATPLDDFEENAAMVNALQRRATIIVQKSLAEGFGLTVTEGMWKGKPVIGSAVGGIADQITPDTGILLPDPTDLSFFGAQVQRLLANPDETARMGKAGQEHARQHFVGDVHLLRLAEVVDTVIAD